MTADPHLMASPNLLNLVYGDGEPFQPELANGKPRCRGRAKSRDGAQCESGTVPGATVCRIHGGAAPQVLRKAYLRLAELRDPAIATLANLMATCPDPAVKLRAANSILDRAGVPRHTELTVEDAVAYVQEEARKFRAELDEALGKDADGDEEQGE